MFYLRFTNIQNIGRNGPEECNIVCIVLSASIIFFFVKKQTNKQTNIRIKLVLAILYLEPCDN